jgi:hypothetical protein
VKNRFQNSPFKFNLQRYIVAAEIAKLPGYRGGAAHR